MFTEEEKEMIKAMGGLDKLIDRLRELDKMEFYCYELQMTVHAKHRPIILIVSNNEKELPDAFLRRCFFYYIPFPERDTMTEIINLHYPNLEEKLIQNSLTLFYELRDLPGLKKRPSTSELIDWIKLLIVGKINAEELSTIDLTQEAPPFVGALLKNEQDQGVIQRLARRFAR